jgi:very-short-patch-repair endonuclease
MSPRRVIRALAEKPDTLVAERAVWGVISTAELRQCGVPDEAIRHRVLSGRLHRVYRGVYAVGHPQLTQEGRFLAAVKACGRRAALSHYSAAVHWGLLEPIERFPDVTAPTGRAHRGINTHRSGSLLGDVVVHRDIPTTTPQRTLKDLERVKAAERTLTRAKRQAQTLGLIRLAGEPKAPTRSVLEDLVLDLILNAGLAHPHVNVPLRIGDTTVIPDFRWPERRLILEADGAAYHDNSRREDAERQAILEASGERVIRVTYHQAVHQREQTVERLKGAGVPSA